MGNKSSSEERENDGVFMSHVARSEYVRALGRASRNIELGLIGSAIVDLQSIVRMLADYQKGTGESVPPDQLKLFSDEQTKETR